VLAQPVGQRIGLRLALGVKGSIDVVRITVVTGAG
jgi:hypothetical protein